MKERQKERKKRDKRCYIGYTRRTTKRKEVMQNGANEDCEKKRKEGMKNELKEKDNEKGENKSSKIEPTRGTTKMEAK